MGGNFSNLDNKKSLLYFIQQEFDKKCQKTKKDYLVLSDILSISLPQDYTFNFCHIGTLFCLDANKDGRFTMDDLTIFADMALQQIKKSSHK